MSDTKLAESLRGLNIFSDVAVDHLTKLAQLCEEVTFPVDTNIFHQHDKAVDVYLILEGQVSLVICDPKVSCRQIGVVGPGEMIGWSPVLERRLLSDTARTTTQVTAIRIDGEKLVNFCRDNPEFGFEFMRRTAMAIAERLSGTRIQLLEVHGIHLPEIQIESD